MATGRNSGYGPFARSAPRIGRRSSSDDVLQPRKVAGTATSLKFFPILAFALTTMLAESEAERASGIVSSVSKPVRDVLTGIYAQSEGRVLMANPALIRMLRYSSFEKRPEAILG